MDNLRRKSFYLYDRHIRLLAEHIYDVYRRTGRRVTESEVIRAALEHYLTSLQRDDTPDPGR